jgi:hypothetical protein
MNNIIKINECFYQELFHSKASIRFLDFAVFYDYNNNMWENVLNISTSYVPKSYPYP